MHNIRVKEGRVLRYDSDTLPDTLHLDFMDVLVVNKYSAGAGVIKTVQEAEDSRLSATRRSNNGDFFSCGNSEGEVAEYRAVRVVTKVDIFESDGATTEMEGLCVRLILDIC